MRRLVLVLATAVVMVAAGSREGSAVDHPDDCDVRNGAAEDFYDVECDEDGSVNDAYDRADDFCNDETNGAVAEFDEGPHPIPYPLMPGQDPDGYHGVFHCWFEDDAPAVQPRR